MGVTLRMVPIRRAGSFYGDTSYRRVVDGVILAESVYRRDQRIPTHEHAHPFLNLVLEGAYTETCGKRARTRGPFSLALHPSGERHADHWHSVGRVFHVEISPSRLEQVRGYSPVLDSPEEFRRDLPSWLAMRLYHEHLRNDAESPLAMEGLLLELLAECSRRRSGDRVGSPPPWLKRVRELLQDRFAENLTLEAIAAEAGVHPVHLARVFRQYYTCTLGDYVRQLRVEFATCELITTQVPLAALACAVGFADQSHFCRTFKRHTGTTPARFRRTFGSR
jgi:AraC family transcriptional regulator